MAFVRLSNWLSRVASRGSWLVADVRRVQAEPRPRIACTMYWTNESPSNVSKRILILLRVAALLREHICAASAARRASIPSFGPGTSPYSPSRKAKHFDDLHRAELVARMLQRTGCARDAWPDA